MKKTLISLIFLSILLYINNAAAVEPPDQQATGQAAKESTVEAKRSKVKAAGLIVGGLTLATIGIILASHNNGSHSTVGTAHAHQ
ncbi:MAG: hypothetical protein KAR79_06185 [Simkaniaceae bacterium]|nr:hypothetical protein [Simkaniaceae bacterium]